MLPPILMHARYKLTFDLSTWNLLIKINHMLNMKALVGFDFFMEKQLKSLEMIPFTGDTYENHVPQHLLPF